MGMLEPMVQLTSRYIHLGERTLTDGTRLIGRAPHVAPQAWLHVIFPAATREQIQKLERGIARPMPPPLRKLLSEANGLMLFITSLAVDGFRRDFSRVGDEAEQPFCLITANEEARQSGASDDLIVFGGYDADGSVLALDTKGGDKVVRCDRDSWDVLNTWRNLQEFLAKEAVRLANLFDDSGRPKNERRSTAPPIAKRDR